MDLNSKKKKRKKERKKKGGAGDPAGSTHGRLKIDVSPAGSCGRIMRWVFGT